MQIKLANCLCLLILSMSKTPGVMALDCSDRIAVAPPLVRDPVLGRWIVAEMQQYIRTVEKLDCDPFLPFERGMEFFDYAGLSFYFGRSPQSLGNRQLHFFLSELQASHLIFLEKSKGKVKARVYRLTVGTDEDLELKAEKAYQQPFDVTAARQHQTPIYIRYLALLTPNTVTLGLTNLEVTMEPTSGYTETGTKTKSQLPAIISSISVNKIEHSRVYHRFDAGALFFPGLFLFAIDQETTLVETESDTTETLNIKVYGGCSNFNLFGSVRTVIGTTYSSIGFGPCVYQSKVDSHQTRVYLGAATRIVFGHRIFVAPLYYLYLELDYLVFDRSLYHSRLADSDRITRGTLGMGWYLPDAESIFVNVTRWMGI